MLNENNLLEQEGGYSLENAPAVKLTGRTKAKPHKDAIDKVKQVAKNVKDVVAGTGGEIERLFTKGLDDETRREIEKEWVPKYYATGNFRIEGTVKKSFLVDLRMVGYMNSEVKNYFFEKALQKSNKRKKYFHALELLHASPPRKASDVPKNAGRIEKSNPEWLKKARRKLKEFKIKEKKKGEKGTVKRWWKNFSRDAKGFPKALWGELTKNLEESNKETNTMNKEDIKSLIKEAFTDKVYGQYPYSHKAGDEEEPKEDFAETWKSFCLEVVQDKSKERAIALAKVLIKDLELFEDVLDLAGQNQSVGAEILKKMEELDKNMI